MKLREPRIAPLDPTQWGEEAKKVMAPLVERGHDYNIFKTLARHPDLMRRWMVFTNHVLGKSTLEARYREILILRIGYLCGSEYEWAQHAQIARQLGMTEEELRSIRKGPDADELSVLERLLLKATDELHEKSQISDATWAGLMDHLSVKQVMDLVYTVGQYQLVSMALNSFGVQLDDGIPGWNESQTYV